MATAHRTPAQQLPGVCSLARTTHMPRLRETLCRPPPALPDLCHPSAGSPHWPTERCGACRTRTTPLLVQSCVAAVDYAYPWDGLVARFKFRSEPGWAGPMAALLLQRPDASDQLRACELMVPVPLTPARLASRGYKQAWELVKAVHRAAPAELQRAGTLAHALVRLCDAPDQHSLTREQRLRNLQGAFAAHPLHATQLTGKRVLLVDDVTTTGATLHSAAQALIQGGALEVNAMVFARTPPG